MKILSSSDLGAAVRARRKELHYTQAFLSDFTGLSVSFISESQESRIF
ncbi:MAG: hypothetical protein LUG27_05190 [Clostridiales bacterium]|nr:hypothetical protein [Clostridiales bacterium]